MTSFENKPFFPTFAVRMLYVFLLAMPSGCLNFQSLQHNGKYIATNAGETQRICVHNVRSLSKELVRSTTLRLTFRDMLTRRIDTTDGIQALLHASKTFVLGQLFLLDQLSYLVNVDSRL